MAGDEDIVQVDESLFRKENQRASKFKLMSRFLEEKENQRASKQLILILKSPLDS